MTRRKLRTCECGCGEVPPLATRNRPERGLVKGEPGRFCRGHRPGARARPRPECDVTTLDACAGPCGGKVHRTAQSRRCTEGHLPHSGHGLCSPCLYAAVADGTVKPRPDVRGHVLDAWVDLAELGTTFREFGERHHTSYPAWERLYLRARKAGDPRAVRVDRGEPVRWP